MRVVSIQLQNFRSFVGTNPIDLDRVNVLVGPNNAGKSSILRAMYQLQGGCGSIGPDVRVGANMANVTIGLVDIPGISN